MVKINEVQVELSEIWHAIIDKELDNNEEGRLLNDCITTLIDCSSTSSDSDEHKHKQYDANCLLSSQGILQLGISSG